MRVCNCFTQCSKNPLNNITIKLAWKNIPVLRFVSTRRTNNSYWKTSESTKIRSQTNSTILKKIYQYKLLWTENVLQSRGCKITRLINMTVINTQRSECLNNLKQCYSIWNTIIFQWKLSLFFNWSIIVLKHGYCAFLFYIITLPTQNTYLITT